MTQRLTLATMIVAMFSAFVSVQPLRAEALRVVQECPVVAALGVAPTAPVQRGPGA
jgi:hypothetical protein